MEDKEYIRNLEIALIFMCECYSKAKEAVGCREGKNNSASNKYSDLWFNFPMIQGSSNIFTIDKIGSLRTLLGNREENTISFDDIFNRIKIGRKTERELSDEVRKSVEEINKN